MDEQPTWQPEGVTLRLDAEARSADSSLPAFLARPEDAPAYHGFLMLKQSRTVADDVDSRGDSWIIPRNSKAREPASLPIRAPARNATGEIDRHPARLMALDFPTGPSPSRNNLASLTVRALTP